MRILIPALLLLALSARSQESPVILRVKAEHGLRPGVVRNDTLSTGKKIADRMKDWKVNGVSIAVIDNDTLAWAKVYGLRRGADTESVLDTATLFQCASIGKIVTTLAALHLVDNKSITLDEDVNNRLVNWKIPTNEFTDKKKVTLRHLLSHSSGLADGYGFKGYAPDEGIPDLLSILNAMRPANNKKRLTIETVPGSIERYSGGGYIIIQQLLEDITRVPFYQFVDSVVFKPFGMMHSTYNDYPDNAHDNNIAVAHHDNGKAYMFDYKIYPENAATGFWTTATDLARLIIGIQRIEKGQSNLLNSKLIAEMLTPQINSMGLGVHLKGERAVTGFWHAGNNEGYTGILMATIPTGQGAVVLTNSNRGEWLAMEILRSVAKTYDWPITLSFRPLPIPNTAELCGLYVETADKKLEINKEKGRLYFTRNGNKKKFYIYQTAKDQFRIAEKPDNLLFIFKRNETGQVTGLAMYENAGSSHLFLSKK